VAVFPAGVFPDLSATAILLWGFQAIAPRASEDCLANSVSVNRVFRSMFI